MELSEVRDVITTACYLELSNERERREQSLWGVGLYAFLEERITTCEHIQTCVPRQIVQRKFSRRALYHYILILTKDVTFYMSIRRLRKRAKDNSKKNSSKRMSLSKSKKGTKKRYACTKESKSFTKVLRVYGVRAGDGFRFLTRSNVERPLRHCACLYCNGSTSSRR